jgi:predicted nucleic acid-binding Zn ribbon protein
VAVSLDRLSRALGAAPARVLTAVFSRWEQLVGAEIAAHARPTSLQGGVLIVVADQPAWAAQLRFMASDLLTRIQTEANAPDIARLEIRTGGARTAERRPHRTR